MSTSPFQKHREEVFSREPSALEKATQIVKEQSNRTFLALLPNQDLKQMPRGYVLLFGGLLLATLCGTFAGLFYQGYTTNRNQVFLSPLIDQTNPSPYCAVIPVANTGTFLATQSGIWQGQNNFIYSEAAYAVTLTNFLTNYSNWDFLMNSLYGDLVAIKNISEHLDLAQNLLYWYSYSGSASSEDTANRFVLTGDPVTVFDREEIVATFTSVAGECDVDSIATFNPAKGALIAQFNAMGFNNDSICQAAVNTVAFGYLPNTNANTFYISLDVRSLVTCVSVNFGLMGFGSLVEITSFRAPYYYDGVAYNTSSYYNPKFPGMAPLTCITTVGFYECIIKLSPYIYGLPIYNHQGNSTEFAEACNCSVMSEHSKQDSYDPCNLFRFIVGVLYYQSGSPDPLFALGVKYHQKLALLNSLAFNASFTASYWGRTSPYYDQFNQPTTRNASYEFCQVNGAVCSMIIFSVFDVFQVDWGISSYYYQLLYGACQNSIWTPYSSFVKLIQQPYTPLVQQYQQCQNSPQQVLFTQLGIQIGNMSAATPACVALIFIIIYLCRRYFGMNIPMGYRANEKQDALDAFAVSLLLARDRREARHHQHLHGSRHNSTSEDVEKQEQQAKVLLDLVEALEGDSELHCNVYRLKNEIVRQKLVNVNWQEAQEAAKRRLQKITHTVPLSIELSPIHLTRGGGRNAADKEELKTFDPTRDSIISTSTTTTTVHPSSVLRPGVAILNKGRSGSSHHHPASSSVSRASTVEEDAMQEVTRLAEEFATLLQEMLTDNEPTPAVERELQQRYWLLVGETVAIQQVPLEPVNQKLLEMLIALVELHAACSLYCSVQVVRASHEHKIAYILCAGRNEEQSVVTLAELREMWLTAAAAAS